MSSRFGALRHVFAWLSPAEREDDSAPTSGTRGASSGDASPDEPPPEREVAPREPEGSNVRDLPVREGSPFSGGRETDLSPSLHVARHLMDYLDARAEEALAALLEGLSRETAREMGKAMDETRRTVSGEIEGIREGILASQREFSRIGRELVRSGASLESIQTSVSVLGPAVQRMEDSLRAELAQERAEREQQLREEIERPALDDMLATLDGLEAGMEAGRELVRTLFDAQHRLQDEAVQRWWRAMGEATGTKQPLPEVPLSDVENWIAGLELTYRRLQDSLARRGVTPIEAVGKPFDPFAHEAVAVEPGPAGHDGLILREERRGYRRQDRVIRLAQVVVCLASEGQPAGDHEPTSDAASERSASQREEQQADGE